MGNLGRRRGCVWEWQAVSLGTVLSHSSAMLMGNVLSLGSKGVFSILPQPVPIGERQV